MVEHDYDKCIPCNYGDPTRILCLNGSEGCGHGLNMDPCHKCGAPVCWWCGYPTGPERPEVAVGVQEALRAARRHREAGVSVVRGGGR